MSPPFPKTPCKRLAKESKRGSDSMPLSRPAFRGSFQEEREIETAIIPAGERSNFQAWAFEAECCQFTFTEPPNN